MLHTNSRVANDHSIKTQNRKTLYSSFRNNNNTSKPSISINTSTLSINNNNNNNNNSKSRPSTLTTAQYVQSQYDYLPSSSSIKEKKEPSLYFRRGTIIEIISKESSDWWYGKYDTIRGWFPSHLVGRVNHTDTSASAASFSGVRTFYNNNNDDDAIQKELDAWKATMMDQQKNRLFITGKKNNVVLQSSNDNLAKGVPIKNRYSTTSIVQQSMTPSKTLSMKPTIKSTLMHQNNKDPHSATHTASSIRKSRVPLPSTPSSTRSSIIFQSHPSSYHSISSVNNISIKRKNNNNNNNNNNIVCENKNNNSTNNQKHNSHHSNQNRLVFKKIINTEDWEKNMDQVSKHMIDLLEASSSSKPSNLHIHIHQTTSVIRTLLSCIHIPDHQEHHQHSYSREEQEEKEEAEEEKEIKETILQQKKSVFHILSKVLHTGSEVQLTGYDEDAKFQTIVQQLWVQIVAFEDIIHTKINPLTNKRSPVLIHQKSLPKISSSSSTAIHKSTLSTPPSSPPRDLLTPRSSTLEMDQLICSLLNHQTQIIDLINTHIPQLNNDNNNNVKKDIRIDTIHAAKNTVFDALLNLLKLYVIKIYLFHQMKLQVI
ncbi:unnamed protein product [Cunninghamella echinulata]